MKRGLKKMRGLTLFETSIVLAIGAVVAAAGVTYYEATKGAREAKETQYLVFDIVDAVHSMLAGFGGYTDLTTATVLSWTELIPARYMPPTGNVWIRTPILGAVMYVAQITAPNPTDVITRTYFSVTISNITAEQCIRLGSLSYGMDLRSFLVAAKGKMPEDSGVLGLSTAVYTNVFHKDSGIGASDLITACNEGAEDGNTGVYMIFQ